MAETKQELLTKKAVDTFMDKWLNDPTFAYQLKTDPESALKSCGIRPSDDLIKSLKDAGPKTSVQELRQRVSKGYTWN